MPARFLVALVAFAVFAALAAPASAHQPSKVGSKHHPTKFRPQKLPPDYAAWSRVATCEEGGWYAPGGQYPDALGIDSANYSAYHGIGMPSAQPVGEESLSERVEDIRAARNLLHRVEGIPYWKIVFQHVGIPDQASCASW